MMRHDLRIGARMLRKSPGFTLTVVITLGLGIGLNSAIFSMVSGILFREPPVQHPDRVVVVTFANPATGSDRNPASALEFSTLRHEGHVFKAVAAAAYEDVAMTGQGEPERTTIAQVTPNYFDLLAVAARLGSTFAPSEDASTQQSNAVISYELWQGRFGGDSDVIGKTVTLAQQTYTVIGVMPAEFQIASVPCAVWTPTSFVAQSLRPDKRDDRSLNVVARLQDGVSIQEAQAQTAAVLRPLEQDNPADEGWTPKLLGLKEALVEPQVRTAITFLMGVVGFVLLIACANVAGLLLARSATRHNEFAVRAALGAGRGRLVQQLLAECLLLALLGGGLGMLVAFSGVKFLRATVSFDPQTALLAGKIEVNGVVLFFTLMVSCLTVLLFGLIPAIQSSSPDLHAPLKEGARTGARRGRIGRTIVVGQVALAMVLMVTTGELVQLVIREMRARLGFDPRQVLTVDLSLAGPKYAAPPRQAWFFTNLVQRIQGLPGVELAGAAQELPESFPPRVGFELEGQRASRAEERPLAASYVVSPDYFRVMRIPLMRGRQFLPSDGAGSARVVIVNQTFVKRFSTKSDPIGMFIRTYSSPTSVADSGEIVGVVGDVIDRVGQNEDVPQVYAPFLQKPTRSMIVAIRAGGDPATLAPAVRASVWAIDKDQPVGTISTMKQVLDHKGRGDRLLGGLGGAFTALALGLAAMGIYGLVSFMVAQRTHEIGLRMALGAQKGRVFRLVIGNGLLLGTVGTALGFLLALPISRILGSAHPDSWVRGLLVLAMAPALVIVATLLACYLPARRATRVDPMMALRCE
jgi:putative ABC transport system permease protein